MLYVMGEVGLIHRVRKFTGVQIPGLHWKTPGNNLNISRKVLEFELPFSYEMPMSLRK